MNQDQVKAQEASALKYVIKPLPDITEQENDDLEMAVIGAYPPMVGEWLGNEWLVWWNDDYSYDSFITELNYLLSNYSKYASIEPLPKVVLKFGQCCVEAKAFDCVCAASWDCAVHGRKHIGTHD